ncbi:hypothetical protein [Muricoccus aerilatus]|uniref:hypothetical protein n=1 Tax=Muricoccus aerilatus TaxID=452982 RepID=UPI0005C1D508|nr:hypothetical protein [Roseomonas aerilata]
MRFHFPMIAVALGLGLLVGCGSPADQLGSDGVAPAAVSWYLPRTEGVDVRVTTEVRSCSPLRIAISTSAAPVVTTDWSNRRSVVIEGMGGLLGTAEFNAETYPEGMVRSLGGKAEDRTGPILAAIAEAVVKFAPLAVGVPGFGGAAGGDRPTVRQVRAGCTDETAADVAALEAALRSLDRTPLVADALTARTVQIERLRARLRTEETVRLALASSPPADMPHLDQPITGQALVQRHILVAVPWTTPPNMTATLRYATGTAPQSVAVPPSADYHYREPVRVDLTTSVVCPAGTDCTVTPTSSSIQFGVAQWGVPRRLPLQAGLFQSLSYSIAFQQDGTPTTQRGASTAAPAEGAAALAKALATSASTDTRTAAIQAEVARNQAELDLITVRAKLAAARSGQ